MEKHLGILQKHVDITQIENALQQMEAHYTILKEVESISEHAMNTLLAVRSKLRIVPMKDRSLLLSETGEALKDMAEFLTLAATALRVLPTSKKE